MKTKLFLIFPMLFLILGGCKGIIDELTKDEDDDEKKEVKEDVNALLGKWTAYEYYADFLAQNGIKNPRDLSKVNLLKELLKYESFDAPCNTKLSKYEIKVNELVLEIKSDKTASMKQNFISKEDTFDENCKTYIADESGASNFGQTWESDSNNKKLTLIDKELGKLVFEVINLNDNELEVLMKLEEGSPRIKLRK